MQNMQKEIEAEGEKEEEAFDKFMCYCDGNTDGMSKSAEEAGQRITELKSKLEAEKSRAHFLFFSFLLKLNSPGSGLDVPAPLEKLRFSYRRDQYQGAL